ncbi:MAG: site-specific DNA-methyltransferase, partial [Kiritimatiellae bacterium]|nr:site-specific DNA-methyltransferase [Kiritimatiellia bacterium]
MIFADPPYSIGKADWDCFSSHEDYLAWCEVWVEQAARI